MTSFLFITDLDNTLVGDDAALKKLNQTLSQHRQEYGTKIVYATGRSLYLYQQLAKEKSLLSPDALITSVGTEIYFDLSEEKFDSQWADILSSRWDREKICAIAAHFADLVLQPETEQNTFKVSFHLSEQASTEVLPRLKAALAESSLDTQLIYSAGYDLDILPTKGDKGLAVQFLRERWNIDAQQAVVCGDSGNDIAMLKGEERGIIVGNAKPELQQWYQDNQSDFRYFARSHYARGILEGLEYHRFV
jgi:sucrose-6F-phosphate phosphohydrolase